MKRWTVVALITLALAAVVVIVGFTQIKAGRASGARPARDRFDDASKTPLDPSEQPRGYSPSNDQSEGGHRGRRQTLRHGLYNVSWL